MTLWIDAQLSPQLAPWLEECLGVAAVAVRDLGLRNAKDREIFLAAREAAAIVMSKDSDFVTLAERHGPPPKLLRVTCGNTSNAYLKSLLLDIFREHSSFSQIDDGRNALRLQRSCLGEGHPHGVVRTGPERWASVARSAPEARGRNRAHREERFCLAASGQHNRGNAPKEDSMNRTIFAALTALFFAAPALAGTNVSVTAPKGFSEGVERIAIVTTSCAPQLDCPKMVQFVRAEITGLNIDAKVVAEFLVKQELFKLGEAEYAEESREPLCEALELDAVLEIDVLFAERGHWNPLTGKGDNKNSGSKVAVRLVKPDGELLFAGTGFGGTVNVNVGPERVASRVVRDILKWAYRNE